MCSFPRRQRTRTHSRACCVCYRVLLRTRSASPHTPCIHIHLVAASWGRHGLPTRSRSRYGFTRPPPGSYPSQPAERTAAALAASDAHTSGPHTPTIFGRCFRLAAPRDPFAHHGRSPSRQTHPQTSAEQARARARCRTHLPLTPCPPKQPVARVYRA
jgi:hypothetical protein